MSWGFESASDIALILEAEYLYQQIWVLEDYGDYEVRRLDGALVALRRRGYEFYMTIAFRKAMA